MAMDRYRRRQRPHGPADPHRRGRVGLRLHASGRNYRVDSQQPVIGFDTSVQPGDRSGSRRKYPRDTGLWEIPQGHHRDGTPAMPTGPGETLTTLFVSR
ncbi:MAG: hypothetical protein MZU79_03910 [Anaerotruncus sp.]|nr:hypothetical protein [Anaerotruncus sp.]